MPVIVSDEGRTDVRDAPKVAECEQCNCSIAGGVSESLLEQFKRHHDHEEAV